MSSFNTTIQLYKGMKLRPDYNDTFWFSDNTAQNAYFESFGTLNTTRFDFSNISYQRVKRGYLRLEYRNNLMDIGELYNVNYMRFKNESHLNKWYYAFVLDVEYINDHCVEIYYKIDVIQTWFFNYTEQACFIEREIPMHDNYGENKVAENLDLGNYYEETHLLDKTFEYCIVITLANAKERDSHGNPMKDDLTDGLDSLSAQVPDASALYYGRINMIGNTYSGLYYIILSTSINDYGVNNAGLLQDVYTVINHQGKANAVLSVNLVPKTALNIKDADGNIITNYFLKILNQGGGEGSSVPTRPQISEKTNFTLLKDVCDIPNPVYHNTRYAYKPRNLKLNQYPFRYLCVSNRMGVQQEYYYEEMRSGTSSNPVLANNMPSIYFGVYATFYDGVKAIAVPENYMTFNRSIDFEYACTGSKEISLPFLCDTYVNYMAQNRASIWGSIISSIAISTLQTSISLSSPEIAMANDIKNAGYSLADNPLNEQVSRQIEKSARISMEHGALSAGRGISTVTGILTKVADMKKKPDSLVAKPHTDSILQSMGKTGFMFIDKHLNNNQMRILDDYFSMYGYACHLVKRPIRRTRQNWTYVKTQNAYITGSLPQSDLREIEQIYDNGIRFWCEPDFIGNYSHYGYPSQDYQPTFGGFYNPELT